MLNKANKIMSQRNEYKDELVNELNTLGFEVEALDNLIPTNTVVKETKEVAPIIINKGQIVKVEVTDDKLQKAYDELYAEYSALRNSFGELDEAYEILANDLANRNERVEDLKDELEIKQGIIDHMKKVHKCETDELKDEIEELKRKVRTLQMFADAEDEVFDEPETTIPSQPVQDTKGGDVMKNTTSAKDKLSKIKKAKDFTLEQAIKEQEEKIARETEEKEAANAKLPEHTLEYETITFDETIDSRTKFGVRGQITIEGKAYFFEATNNHHMPIVYGCFDEATRNLVKEIMINKIDKFNFMNELEGAAANYSHAHDEMNPLVVWRLTDANGKVNYHGYTDKYILTWDKDKFAKHPGRKMIKNAFSDAPNMWKRVPNQQLADKFMAVCKELYPADFTPDNDPEPTKAVKQITKEQHQPTNETVKVTKESNAVRYNGPIDNFGCTKENNNVTNDDFDMECDDLDL